MAIYAAVDTIDHAGLLRVEAPLGSADDILRVHPRSHLDAIEQAIPSSGSVALDADTHVSPGSLRAALRGVGAMTKAIDMVLDEEVQNAFAAVRPPGHHAETSTPMGFCLFGNIAIGAKYALDVHGLKRVALVDFDVHHGNGTQDLLWNEPRVLFASSHQMPLYPGSGYANETGASDNVLNVPLDAGADGRAFRQAYERTIFPALEDFAPELILISAGFDAHARDPLANLMLTEADFAWVTEKLCDIADTHAKGRIVSTLEGGYDLDALAASTKAHLEVLLERGAT
ncbi:acetoin utilization protein [Litoreibacter roseus]|uniref:Acetoin utilization protein n=2 Tax=Litoreibacter roseus TaxID=2601869 RepID=A0A6N6JFZ8_9RHOB|nr:acetoin utilization protein [Litoreibacter roseus]